MTSFRISEWAASLLEPEIEKIPEDVLWEVGLQQSEQGPMLSVFFGIPGSVLGSVSASAALFPVQALKSNPEVAVQVVKNLYEACQQLRTQQLQQSAPSEGIVLPNR